MKTVQFPRNLTISWLREMYLSQTLTPVDVVKEILNRVETDKDMNIWITPPSMERIEFYLKELEVMDPLANLLWGIPFAIKDNIDLAGVETTAGCSDYAYIPEEHATVIERLIQAGAIPMGKANLDQFATGLVGTRSPYGETHNALKEELISGGSSSGPAVAVAMGHAAFALGTDTAGSGRVPAALNRLIGYKPSLGAWPAKGVVPACASLDCVTVFAHQLDEALTVDNVVRGLDESDPWSREWPRSSSRTPDKICLPNNSLSFFGPFEKEYREAWSETTGKLESLNIPIEYVDTALFAEAASLLYDGPWAAERWSDLSAFVEGNPGSTHPVTEEILRSGARTNHDAVSVFHAMHKLQAIKQETRSLLKNAVLIMPTCGGTWTREEITDNPIETNSQMGLYTNHCNLLDLCALALPSDDAAQDLPFGISLFALSENESLICGAGKLFLKGPVEEKTDLAAKSETTLLAVCGLHMRGCPLEEQMKEYNATFVREAMTASKYQLIKLPTTPAKPGLIKQSVGGQSIQIELWEMPLEVLGRFITNIPSPLGIGKVELDDGTEVPGFICESYLTPDSEDITACGGWRSAVNINY